MSASDLKRNIKANISSLPEFSQNYYKAFMKDNLSLPDLQELYYFVEEDLFIHESQQVLADTVIPTF